MLCLLVSLFILDSVMPFTTSCYCKMFPFCFQQSSHSGLQIAWNILNLHVLSFDNVIQESKLFYYLLEFVIHHAGDGIIAM